MKELNNKITESEINTNLIALITYKPFFPQDSYFYLNSTFIQYVCIGQEHHDNKPSEYVIIIHIFGLNQKLFFEYCKHNIDELNKILDEKHQIKDNLLNMEEIKDNLLNMEEINE